MKYSEQYLSLFLFLLIFFLLPVSAICCELADHSWKGDFIDFNINWPVSLIAELNICSAFLPSSLTKELFFITDRNIPQAYFSFFKSIKDSWLNQTRWVYRNKNTIVSDSEKITTKEHRSVLRFDDYKIRIGFFRDQNSNFFCKQLVILQQGKMKLLQLKNQKPQVNSFFVRTWISVKFWKNLLPANILSIEIYPWNDHIFDFYHNQTRADSLLRDGRLKVKHDFEPLPAIESLPGYSSK